MRSFVFCTCVLLVIPVAVSNVDAGVVLFQDDFNDGNANGWNFVGNDAGEWGVLSGALNSSTGNDDLHDANAGLAYIDGIMAPDHFVFEADVRVIRSANGYADFGHVGFAWGFDGSTYTYPTSSIVFTYLRTHLDQTTTFSQVPSSPERLITGLSATWNVTYHLRIEVDHLSKFMQVSFDNVSTTFTASEYDDHVKHSGGNIGLVNWGEEVSYDNVRLIDQGASVVPEPSSLAIFGLMGLATVGFRRRAR